jgi:hypothetical protein
MIHEYSLFGLHPGGLCQTRQDHGFPFTEAYGKFYFYNTVLCDSSRHFRLFPVTASAHCEKTGKDNWNTAECQEMDARHFANVAGESS